MEEADICTMYVILVGFLDESNFALAVSAAIEDNCKSKTTATIMQTASVLLCAMASETSARFIASRTEKICQMIRESNSEIKTTKLRHGAQKTIEALLCVYNVLLELAHKQRAYRVDKSEGSTETAAAELSSSSRNYYYY
jgi:hypothetical protein